MNPEDIFTAALVVLWGMSVVIGTAGLFCKTGRPVWPAFVPGVNGVALLRWSFLRLCTQHV